MKLLIIPVITMACVASAVASDLNPIVMLPGLGGSWIDAKLDRKTHKHSWCDKKSDWYNIWLNPAQLLPEVIECFKDNFKLIVDPNTGLTSNTEGVETRVPEFGNVTSISQVSPGPVIPAMYYYKYMIDALLDKGYVEGKSLRGAPYDFRKAPNEQEQYFKDLKKLVEETYSINNNKKVILITHSLGTMYSYYFLTKMDQPWKDKFIHTYVPIAPPLGGAGGAVDGVLGGSNFHIPFYNDKYLRAMERSFPSLSFLLPNPLVWKNRVIMVMAGVPHTASDIDKVLTHLNDASLKAMHAATKDLMGDFKHPGVNVSCIVGKGFKTPAYIHYENPEDFPDTGIVMFGDGDGTVNSHSADACLLWQDNKDHKFDYKTFPYTHLDIIKDKNVIQYIIKSFVDN